MAVLDIYIAYIVDWDRFIQVLYLGRAPRTKETLPDFLKWRRVTRPPLVFRGLTGSQRTPGFWGVTIGDRKWEWKSVPPRGTDVGSVGCPWTAHLLCFGTVKTVPGLCKMGHKCPCVLV